ncbi:DUF6134 family protein [Geobacter sp. SVR]|uniref:DUF3108 domain-containing protein n=1 Tax=Geobacter sp. SVR TaxID=2495594 RepID=UPI00143EF4C0|nr:DUF6134 family protein [Geobacter sp. SVR]BCS53380.1 hypothetical protein GSVR_16880 [Geobacter sp. SVR]GCF85494.1 hypothetical protein GSbR_20940 [Geobacter sp. SVR]
MNILNHKKWILLLTLLVALLPASPSGAEPKGSTLSSYSVYSKGFRIGTITSSQQFSEQNGSPVIRFETRTTVKAAFLWLRYSLNTVESGILKNGALIAYSRYGEDNGVRIDVEGRLEDDHFRFDIREHGVPRTVTIPRRSYEATTMEFPEARLDFHGKAPVSIRVLDVEHLAVVAREYRFDRDATCTISGKHYPCQVLEFSDQNKSARRWIRKENGTVLMYRQDGSGAKSSYSVQATSIVQEP